MTPIMPLRFSADIRILGKETFWRRFHFLSTPASRRYEPYSVHQRRELTDRSPAKSRYVDTAFDCTILQLSAPKQPSPVQPVPKKRGFNRSMLHFHLQPRLEDKDETRRCLPEIIRRFKDQNPSVAASIWGGDTNDPRFSPDSTQNKSVIEGVLNSLEIPFRKLWGQRHNHGVAAYETRRGHFYLHHSPFSSGVPVSVHPSKEWLCDHYSECQLLPGDRLFINDKLVLEEPAR